MIRLNEFLPDLPKAGWPGRKRAIVRELAKVVGLTALLLGMWALVYVYIVVLS